jgi:predicted nucleotidyltransferase
MTGPAVNELELRRICVRYGIATLRIFGSAARGDAGPTSDVDVLYELQPGRKLGWEIEDLNQELTKLFGRPVDLVSKKSLHPLLRETVLSESRALYAA